MPRGHKNYRPDPVVENAVDDWLTWFMSPTYRALTDKRHRQAKESIERTKAREAETGERGMKSNRSIKYEARKPEVALRKPNAAMQRPARTEALSWPFPLPDSEAFARRMERARNHNASWARDE